MRIDSCSLCPRACGALREAERGGGFCRMGADPVVARAALHAWEEPCISGTRGSGTVFFSGCTLRCVYCQNYEISAGGFGRRITPTQLALLFERLQAMGAHNINLVNPTHFIPAILQAFSLFRPAVPVVYNSSGYESAETLRLLEGYVDIYLPDLKYANEEDAARYSAAPDYFARTTGALCEMHRQTGPALYNEEGLLQKGLLIRHLILPGHTRAALAVLDWVKENLPNVPVSLMAQYTPCGRAADFPEIDRRITRREYDKVLSRLLELELDGYVQELSSAKEEYIPPFDLTGVKEL